MSDVKKVCFSATKPQFEHLLSAVSLSMNLYASAQKSIDGEPLKVAALSADHFCQKFSAWVNKIKGSQHWG